MTTQERLVLARAARDENRRLLADAIAIMRMNGWSVLDVARRLRVRPSTVRAALGRGAK